MSLSRPLDQHDPPATGQPPNANWFKRLPSAREAFFFAILCNFGESIMQVGLLSRFLKLPGITLSAVIFLCTPALPYDLRIRGSYDALCRQTPGIYLYTVFFCLVMNGILTAVVGTWRGADPSVLYYSKDYYNWTLYAFVVPVYVTAAILLICGGIQTIESLTREADIASDKNAASGKQTNFSENSKKFTRFVAISLFLTLMFTTLYIHDLTDPATTKITYWFLTAGRSSTGDEIRSLNAAGAYYLLMNAILLFITFIAAITYLTVSYEVVRIGRHIETSPFATEVTAHKLAASLRGFFWCYSWAKVLIVAYAINIVIWSWSPPGAVRNLDAAIVALALVGLLVIPFPRLYVEYRWYKLKGQFPDVYADLRSDVHKKVILTCNVLSLCLITYIYSHSSFAKWFIEFFKQIV